MDEFNIIQGGFAFGVYAAVQSLLQHSTLVGVWVCNVGQQIILGFALDLQHKLLAETVVVEAAGSSIGFHVDKHCSLIRLGRWGFLLDRCFCFRHWVSFLREGHGESPSSLARGRRNLPVAMPATASLRLAGLLKNAHAVRSTNLEGTPHSSLQKRLISQEADTGIGMLQCEARVGASNVG